MGSDRHPSPPVTSNPKSAMSLSQDKQWQPPPPSLHSSYVACIGKMLRAKASCRYEVSVSFLAVVGSATAGREGCRSDLVSKFRKHLATWDKVLHVLSPIGVRTVKNIMIVLLFPCFHLVNLTVTHPKKKKTTLWISNNPVNSKLKTNHF